MLPALLAQDTRDQVISFLETTFSFRDPTVWEALQSFLDDSRDGLFKGPYLSLELPYRKVDASVSIPLAIRPGFLPYQHQADAWLRLAAEQDGGPRHTLVTTGTSSGKTECFLFPLVDHCWRQRQRKGIKAIILYPMNALATDQAKRLAQIINGDARLKGVVRAGMYVGGQHAGDGTTAMSATQLITNRESLRDDPPDILLTNYKMLDLLLLRPEDRGLWQHQQPDTLRYLVVDELHTFDGAQGAEVACLIRRLRSRLGTPDGGLCCVGTSATIAGEGDSGRVGLAAFASTIFGAVIAADAIVGETRLSLAAYLDRCLPLRHRHEVPGASAVSASPDDTFESYLSRISTAWFGQLPTTPEGTVDSEALGALVQGAELFPALLRAAVGRIQPLASVVESLGHDIGEDPAAGLAIVGSFLALVAEARWRQAPGDPLTPILAKSQVQIWIREMSRLGRVLTAGPAFRWLADETEDHPTHKALPPWFCRECGASGWLAVAHENDRALTYQRQTIYDHYFSKSKHIRYIVPTAAAADDTIPEVVAGTAARVCPACCWFGTATETKAGACPGCTAATLALRPLPAVCVTRKTRDEDTRTCPACGAIGHLAIVGSQAASLASIALGHLYTHPLNKQPKLLAFTDSVQDASHRAGFFQARTFRVGLRTAIARYLHATGAQPLDGIAGRMLTWWQAQPQQSPAMVIANLTPPDLAEVPDYADAVSMKPSLSKQAAMLQLLARRLQWDIHMELGLNSRRGRTLEKAAVAHVACDETALRSIASRLATEVSAELGLSVPIPVARWTQWLRGLVTKVRMSGGIWHPYAEKYAEELGKDFWLARSYRNPSKFRDELPPAHGQPLFPASPSNGTDFLPFGMIGRQRETWLSDFTRRWAVPLGIGDAFLDECSRRAVQALVHADLWSERKAGTDTVWGWNPQALRVVPEGVQIRCGLCNHHLTVGDAEAWMGATCLTPKCPGTYQAIAAPERARADFYRRRYLSGTIKRIFAHEHTGLLERGDRDQVGTREWVEAQFIASGTTGARADALNLLTCTSTMEMGINIGDLSSTMLCSVPPTTANYLQRIGRAGRGTGAALIVSMATSRSHDLHFFSDPLAMMAGAVDTPGCFLDAPEVIARHFLAWCIDALVRDGVITAESWPHQVRDLHRQWSGNDGALFAIHQRLSAEQQTWEARFRSAFGPAMSELGWQKLHPLIQAPRIHQMLKRAADAFELQRQDYDDRLRVLRKEREQLKKVDKPDDETVFRRAEVDQQIRAIELRRKDLSEQNSWPFLTDLGILPNYAFPESGVRLNAEVYFPRPWGRDPERFEWVRGAGEAIRDLAPGNTFYAQKRRFTISRVEMGTPDNAEVTRWRFCSRCTHSEEVKAATATHCPECQASDWQDLGRMRSMHRLRAVASTMDHFDSQAFDDSDDRRQERYQVEDFFSIDHTSHVTAWAETELPFGFELVGRVTLRQVNVGPAMAFAAEATIAGKEMPAQGYRVCADCGYVADGRGETRPKDHRLWCLGRKKAENGDEKPWRWHGGDHQPYLYRELASEALRLLLPAGILDSRQDTVSFTAALGLGLRLRFGGNPDHLIIRPQQQPIGDSGASRTYLLVFDQVPGGTGYLRELARPEVLRECLQRALRHLLACDCRVPTGKGKDDPELHPAGCYKCLLSYTVSHQREHLRREAAITLLDRILKRWDALTPQANNSLGDVPDVKLIESALERKFLIELQKAVTKAGGTWRDDLIGGKAGVAITLDGRSWKIEPQVSLGPAQGVEVPCQPDFVIRPVAPRPEQLPVAIFLDGYRYHACLPDTGDSRLPDDLSKRAAVRASNRFLVWSLTWKDLEGAELGQAEMAGWFDTHRWRELTKIMGSSMAPLPELFTDGFRQLVAYLQRPHVADWTVSLGRFLAFGNMTGIGTTEDKLGDALRAWTAPAGGTPDPRHGDGAWKFATKPAGPDIQALIAVHTTDLMPALMGKDAALLAKHVRVVVHLHDARERRAQEESFVPIWRRFQALANLLQFLPASVVTSTETNEQRQAPSVVAPGPDVVTPPASPWTDLLPYVQTPYRQLAQRLAAATCPVPVVGYELIRQGDVVGVAELAWPAQTGGIALVIGGASADAVAFVDQGWTVIDADAADAVERLLNLLRRVAPTST
jgi:DEAD/DEAH box helicase domain-containing protein